MKIYQNTSELIGNTPLLKLNNIENKYQLKSEVYAKVEAFNPGGSVKDRIAKAMIDKAISDGLINDQTQIIEATSGNTGIGLASVCAQKGLKLTIVMPETMSIERRKLIQAYGAEIVLTKGELGMPGAMAKAQELAEANGNSFIPSQFENTANPDIHYATTGKEIYADLDGQIDYFVAGVGTGGTLSGVGRYLKAQNPKIKIIAVEPSGSPVISKGIKGPHKIQGIGAGFIPKNLDRDIIDEVILVDDEKAMAASRTIGQVEGLLVGISSGAAAYAAMTIAEKVADKKIVCLLPDTGERYLSTELYDKGEIL